MTGEWLVRVQDLRAYTIHGDLYVELTVQPIEEGSTTTVLKVAEHALGTRPGVGDKLKVSFLMGQVDRVDPA